MSAYLFTLRLLAIFILFVSGLHALLGHGAESLLGVHVPSAAATDPSQDSQNRFFGMAFSLYAAVLLLAASDLPRYVPILRAALVIFFLAGLARLGSIAAHGLPAPPIVALLGVELIAPPVLYLWLRKVISAT